MFLAVFLILSIATAIMGNVQACSSVAHQLHEQLSASDRFHDLGFTLYECRENAFSFRVGGFPEQNTYRFEMLSVSVPPDAIGNREGEPSTYETALIGSNSVVYDSDLGYDDVLRFESLDEILDEFLRLYNMCRDAECVEYVVQE